MRIVLATGRPELNAAIAATPGVEVVADAYYADAAATAVEELHPDAAIVSGTLPGAKRPDWEALAASSSLRVIWLGPGCSGPREEDGGVVSLAEDADTVAIATALAPNGATVAEPRVPAYLTGDPEAPSTVHVFLGCIPRVGVSTAAASFTLALAGQGHSIALVDANFNHPALAEVLGYRCPAAGWDTVNNAHELVSVGIRTRDAFFLPCSCDASDATEARAAMDRLGWVIRALADQGWAGVVVDLGSPRPIERGRPAGWLQWLASEHARARLIVAQDPQALVNAARILRTADAVSVRLELWCASYDEHLSTLAELGAALGRPCSAMPWDRQGVVARALAGKPPMPRLPRWTPAGVG